MYRLRIKSIIGIAVIAASCAFADLRPVEVETSPSVMNAVLPNPYSPLEVSFNTAMIKEEAESLLTVSSGAGMVEGDRIWNGNRLVFVPLAGWTAGTRYTLGLSGTARSADGRELRADRSIPFFAVNRSKPPLIAWHSPSDGESVYAQDLFLEIHFSKAMNTISVESALSTEGMPERTFAWSDEGDVLTIYPARNLSPWTQFRWTLRAEAQCADGVPLAKAYSAVFITDKDRIMPQVSAVYPVLQSGNNWIPTGGALETDLGPGLSIAVEFNKAMSEAAFRSLRFDPSLNGRTEITGEKTMIFVPARDPDPETVYTLIISGDARDTEGLKIGRDYRRVFIPDIPYLRVLSIQAAGDIFFNPDGGEIIAIPVSEADGKLAQITIHFSLPFNDEAKQKTALAITMLPFFPGSLDPIALRFVSWLGDDRLNMAWERVSAGSAEQPHYYRLFFPGGRGGIDNGSASYLQKDIIQFMEAVQ